MKETGLGRKSAPKINSIDEIEVLNVKKKNLKNGVPVYLIDAGVQDVVKIDLVFESGQWFCQNPLLADFTSRMIIEGSKDYSSAEIAEKFDFYGTFSNFECGKHFTSVQLYCLSNHFKKSIEILGSYLKHPTFPDNEFSINLKNDYQKYILSREKTEVLAFEAFYEKVFGKNHPYGKSKSSEDFENLKVGQLKEYHQQYYHPGNCKIVVAGKLRNDFFSILDHVFGGDDWGKNGKKPDKKKETINSASNRFNIYKEKAVQSSIKIGNCTISKKDVDFHGLSILNTVLGGYFGSRLMTNLREKNALTYGIYSSLSSLLHAGVFSISANVNSEQVDNAIGQIYKEIKLLKTDLISENELDMVKNYLSGEMLRAFDGPLPVSDIYAGLLNYKLDFSYYQRYFETLKSINSKSLRELANQYLDQDNFTEIVVGNIK